jgi:hypothetical protein
MLHLLTMTTSMAAPLSDRDSATSRSSRLSMPLLRDENDDDNEIVIFGDSDECATYEYDGEYGYDELDGDLPQGYTRSELARTVLFVKSSKDKATGEFARVKKDLLWCLENGCEEAEPGVWSGAWYFTFLHGQKEGNLAWIEAQNKRLVKESDGRARKIDNASFCKMLAEKAKGNKAFSREQYNGALESYLRAEECLGGAVSGFYLVPHQRAELVKVLSNQAECYLRMQKYKDCIIQATSALQLDMRHEKSLLRRAKAIIFDTDSFNSCHVMVAYRACEDLEVVIALGGDGVNEAKALLKKIEDAREKAKVSRD